MKEIKAYIKPHKLADVTLALRDLDGLTGLSVTDARGFGRGRAKDAIDRVADGAVEYIPQVRLEVVCQEELTEQIVNLIQENAHTGLRGDGKIFISDVKSAVRISTGERDDDVV